MVINDQLPNRLPNIVGGESLPPAVDAWFDKRNPHDGRVLWQAARSQAADVANAVAAAAATQSAWGGTAPVRRGEILHDFAMALRAHREAIARVVAAETGKSFKAALGETDGAIALGQFFAGEGQRLYGRTTTSGTASKFASTVRQPIGVAGLIVPANTPIANVAWKSFPALICGNTAVLKSAEDAPGTAWIFARVALEAGMPAGVLNVIHGLGPEAGDPLVRDERIGVISFTGSTAVGKQIAAAAGGRLARASLELGGKNPFVVCDDADLAAATRWAALSAFSNAGQRCAAGSRIIVLAKIYDDFRDRLVAAAAAQKVGSADDDDFGPVINERHLDQILAAVSRARSTGAVVLTGGHRLEDTTHRSGYYMTPTLIENVGETDEISTCELFGPIATLYRVSDYSEALRLANASPYGLTAAIHTRSINRALHFVHNVAAGVAVVNGGTFGSEPHMPFGGVKQSGNGTREPGTEALYVYSELKNIYLNLDSEQLD